MSRGAPQRRSAARETALRLTPRQFHRRDAMSAGYGATGRRIRLRMLQAGFSASGMEARQGGDSLAGSVHDSPPRAGDARNSGQYRKVRGPAESLHDPVRTSDITAHHPVTGKPGLQRRRRCFPLFRQAPACQGFFARADRRHPCCP
ncbi:TPA: hypothetical protein MPK85_004843 [Salmonella enterica]|nr:hypothetical protein [Salmonella enterica]